MVKFGYAATGLLISLALVLAGLRSTENVGSLKKANRKPGQVAAMSDSGRKVNLRKQDVIAAIENLPAPESAQTEFERRALRDIAEVRDASFEELTSSLRLSDDAWAMLMTRILSNDNSILMIRGVLSDRRMSRLHELLSEMPPDQAASHIIAAYDSRFEDFARQWEQAGYGSNVSTQPVKLCLCGLLFLCSEHCNPDVVLSKIDTWNDWFERNLETAPASVPSGFGEFRREGAPDPLFVCNLYMKCMIDQGVAIDELNAQLDAFGNELGVGAFPDLTNSVMSHWVAHRPEHFREAWARLSVVPVFQTCHPASEFFNPSLGARPEKIRIVLSELRSWVDELNSGSQR